MNFSMLDKMQQSGQYFAVFCTVCINSYAQNIGIGTNTPAARLGIGTNTPAARLHVMDSSVLFSAEGFVMVSPGDPPLQGEGRRMMWYADKAAFRSGYVSGANWDKNNVGIYSIATGFDTKAIGPYSTAMGYNTTASGYFSSTAMGHYTKATNSAATAMGSETIASGVSSTAMGKYSFATGDVSTAFGGGTTASGEYSTSMGFSTIASGNKSFAAGSLVSTNNHEGSFFFGDADPNLKGIRPLGFDNHFAARFNGGYYFISSDAGGDIGVRLLPGSNSWSAISDVNRKENFLAVNGESFLKKIAALPLTTWNYNGQSPKDFRHYGPMAQDFNEAFGKDDLGTIGCDTLINQQDFLGVNLIAIQALEKRTSELKAENSILKTRLDKMEKLLMNAGLKSEALTEGLPSGRK